MCSSPDSNVYLAQTATSSSPDNMIPPDLFFCARSHTKNRNRHFYPLAKSRRKLKLRRFGVIFRARFAMFVEKIAAPPKPAVCSFPAFLDMCLEPQTHVSVVKQTRNPVSARFRPPRVAQRSKFVGKEISASRIFFGRFGRPAASSAASASSAAAAASTASHATAAAESAETEAISDAMGDYFLVLFRNVQANQLNDGAL